MTTAVLRRQFTIALDAKRGTFATDGSSLYEIIATRGLLPTRDGFKIDSEEAAVKLLDCSLDLPDDLGEEIVMATWVPVFEMEGLEVVEAIRHDGAR